MDAHDYILNFLRLDHPHLETVAAELEHRDDIQPGIGPEVGKLLGLLARATQARRVLELGTCLGYSTLWLAAAMRETGGRLTSVEYDRDLCEQTRANLVAAGLLDWVDLIHGDAAEVVRRLEGQYDLILQDSAKDLYPALLEDCLRLLRPLGILAADDALFYPLGIPEKFSAPVHRYNEKVFSDPRLYTTLLPIGDGLAVSVKLM